LRDQASISSRPQTCGTVGVHEMSSALKRRFNFETVRPIGDRALEKRLVQEQTQALLDAAGIAVTGRS